MHKTHEEHPSSVRRHRKQLSRAATCDRIAANQERRRIVRPTIRLLTGSSDAYVASRLNRADAVTTCDDASQQPLSPFVPARRVITPSFSQTGRDCLAAHSRPYWSYGDCVRAFARNTARLPPSSTQATLPHYGFSRGADASDCKLPLACSESPTPLASLDEALRDYFHLVDQTRHRVAKPGGRSGCCVSVGLRS